MVESGRKFFFERRNIIKIVSTNKNMFSYINEIRQMTDNIVNSNIFTHKMIIYSVKMQVDSLINY
jgi:hypothetical protein